MAEIDKAIGLGKAIEKTDQLKKTKTQIPIKRPKTKDKAIRLGKAIEKRKKRSINENQNPETNKENQNIIKPIKTQLRTKKIL